MLWWLFNKNGQFIGEASVDGLPFAGTTDFQIFAAFQDIDLLEYGSATIKLYRPDFEESALTILPMIAKESYVYEGVTNNYFINGQSYKGFYLDFGEYGMPLLDTVGLWRAVITILSNTMENYRNVVGSTTFSVGNGIEIEEINNVELDDIISVLTAQLGAKLNINSSRYIKVITSENIEEYEFGAMYNEGDIIFNRVENKLYILVLEDDVLIPTHITLESEEANVRRMTSDGNLTIQPTGVTHVKHDMILDDGDLRVVEGDIFIQGKVAATEEYVGQQISSAISNVYKFQGSATVSVLNSITPTSNMNGYVYNVTTDGLLTNGDGTTVSILNGDNVAIVWENNTWRWDVLSAFIDVNSFVTNFTTEEYNTADLTINFERNIEKKIVNAISTSSVTFVIPNNVFHGWIGGCTLLLNGETHFSVINSSDYRVYYFLDGNQIDISEWYQMIRNNVTFEVMVECNGFNIRLYAKQASGTE